MSGNESNMPYRPSSDVGFERADECEDGTQSEQSGSQDQNWRLLFEMQNSNMKALIEALHKPQQSGKHVNLPEFDPDKTDVDARSWCATADLCLTDNPLEGGQLIVVISKALKGVASAWLSQISYAGMTWPQFKELFMDRFVSAETPAATLINLNSDKPKENETLAAYGSRVMTSLLNRWKKATIEQIAVSQTLAHVAQFDTRLQRLAFTTEINTRQKLQQELQAFTYLKRKINAVGDQKGTDNKRMKISPAIKCYHCGKNGHKQKDCLLRKKDGKSNPVKSQQNTTITKPNLQQQTTSRAIVCFKCGTTGHIANRCTGGGGADASTVKERRVDVCEVDPPAGTAKHQDCLHLQLYRDPKDRFKKGQTKASLSLQQFLGFESGFTLDKESNTIAIICQDVIVVLAFETRERLIAWQVKVGSQLGSSKEWLVLIGGGSRKLPAGPARLHLQGRRFALASGVPPRLLGLWELAHLRRYGVVEGRFCFEGGSHCGKGEGLHVLITDQAQDITDGFDSAVHGNPRGPASRKSGGADRNRPDTRLSDINPDQSIPDTGLYEENFFGEDCEGVSPFWPSDERRGFDDHDCKGCEENTRPPWSGADHVTLERCSNCVTKLGTMTRSSTVALTPGTQFNPAWTMEAVPESSSDNSSNSTEYLTPRAIRKSLEASQNKEWWAPQRPPKPARLEEIKAPAPLPVTACTCASDRTTTAIINNPKVGPYENYDVPKATHVEMEPTNEYYDTPKRIKKALAEDLFQVTKNSAPGNLVLKKNCGCILKFGSKKKPVIVECEENIQPVECPCQKVTNWANNLISLPYCKRSENYDKVNTEILTSQKSEEMALYATVDVSRKTNRQSSIAEKDSVHDYNETPLMNYENLGPKGEEFEDPYANYENLEFALSLEYYENAKDLLKKAGVTQKELDALSANVDFAEVALPPKSKHCAKCGHSAKHQIMKKNKSDEYLLMEPPKDIKRDLCRTTGPNPGYTPMSPNPNWSQSLRHPLQKFNRVEIEKSLSIPTLNGGAIRAQTFDTTLSNNNKEAIQKRSSSVDSARLLEDLKEFDSSIGSHATSSSLETLRNLAIENRRTSSPCDNERECCDHDCCKSSDSENKTSEGSSKDVPHLRNKHMDNAQIKRSSNVPCKSGGNRDSSSSNDSGVSSCSMKHGPEINEFEMPLTSGYSRYQYMAQRRMRGNATGCIHSSLPRKSKSSDPLRDMTMQIHKANVPAKSSSAEAEVPVLPPKQFKGVMDTHSTSSGTSDMSDYIETLSLTSSHSSSDNPNLRLARQPTTTLRPRSGKEYHNLDPIITSMYKSGKELSNYTNLP